MHLLKLILLFSLCIWMSANAQTPYDSFAPETSRPILTSEALSREKCAQDFSSDTTLLVAMIDRQQERILLVDMSDGSIVAYAPLTDNKCHWLSPDPLLDKYPEISPYAYCSWNPMRYVDKDGRDSIYFNDQSNRPLDNGIPGKTYTATVIVLQNGEIVGEYRGSSYPNSISNNDNSTLYNTINEGVFTFNNKYGHKAGTEQGLNIVDDKGKRVVPGKNPIGEDVIIEYGNVHSGKSDKGNYNSRGSKACLTIHPDDATAFFSHFTWTNNKRTIGTSEGRIFIRRRGINEK